ncbi:flagellar biosynthetic protein FliO [Alkalihalobacillus sp. MEB130]|uniref:flagellar biosynthetic protein FliO n=1 Tax=Alkalihalobacillus sp. MEB130 TaxID=2976704 RepID=UPI0028E0090A|nr:flagellar biosynthetic protein FliO [Alkalihalobacillus sp. MEB130]MDT8859014.1 flagellar biosynthetic protein FliO [Alkalihalobacillus sp. MEB130]
MGRKLLILALILLLPVGGAQNIVEATTTDENRRVSETLNGNQTTDEPAGEQETISDAPVSETETEQIAEMEIIPEQNTFLIFAQMISALALVVVLIYVLLRFLNKRSQSFRSSKTLENIGGVPLGANKSVQLIKIGERVLVVGVGDSIQLLKEIEDETEVESLLRNQQDQLEQFDQPIEKAINWISDKINTKGQQGKGSTTKETKGSQDPFKSLLENQLKDVSKSQQKLRDAARERDI